MKYSEIAAGHKSKGVTIFLFTLVYPNGQGRAHSRVKTKSGGIPLQHVGNPNYPSADRHQWARPST